ncbi:hypothetical protein NDU88_004808 [Pleurodeles waltl]|uniref:Uncharacterized protein n=1 Tax=Pleurodeles waltl TaxID=8319 RepID=A0AAV7SJV5_PLEWA|nr:hypothetical protein NDU88_004808 [Pleurodeles waltl]
MSSSLAAKVILASSSQRVPSLELHTPAVSRAVQSNVDSSLRCGAAGDAPTGISQRYAPTDTCERQDMKSANSALTPPGTVQSQHRQRIWGKSGGKNRAKNKGEMVK